ncbi:MAG: perosamine synthetase [Gammaproteobacteria bacterium]|jgi:perosamine synthetase
MSLLPRVAVEAPAPEVLSYGRQLLDEEDIAAVVAALRSDFLTQGPTVARFEAGLCEVTGAQNAIAVANGTLALEVAYGALGVGPGARVLVPANTFVATATAAERLGATVEFIDVELETGNLDLAALARRLAKGPTPDLVVPVQLKRSFGFAIVEDAAHALGARYFEGSRWWSPGEHPEVAAAVYSFHPVKPITSAEGGAVMTPDATLAERVRLLRGQGIDGESARREGHLHYAPMVALGTNARLSELHAALGLSQLAKLNRFRTRRAEIAARYRRELFGVTLLEEGDDTQEHAWHLFVIQVDPELRDPLRAALLEKGVGTQVHYHPVPYQPWFQRRNPEVEVPVALEHAESALSLPLHPGLTEEQVGHVIRAVNSCFTELSLAA